MTVDTPLSLRTVDRSGTRLPRPDSRGQAPRASPGRRRARGCRLHCAAYGRRWCAASSTRSRVVVGMSRPAAWLRTNPAVARDTPAAPATFAPVARRVTPWLRHVPTHPEHVGYAGTLFGSGIDRRGRLPRGGCLVSSRAGTRARPVRGRSSADGPDAEAVGVHQHAWVPLPVVGEPPPCTCRNRATGECQPERLPVTALALTARRDARREEHGMTCMPEPTPQPPPTPAASCPRHPRGSRSPAAPHLEGGVLQPSPAAAPRNW